MKLRWHFNAWSAAMKAWADAVPRCADPACPAKAWIWRFLRRRAGIRLHQEWYCSPQCFENAARRYFARAGVAALAAPSPQHRIPLGLLMLSRGQLDNTQLRAALDAQRDKGGRIGRWLEKLGFATEQQITAALGLQWACPVVTPLAAETDCAALLPFRLMTQFRMLPIHFASATRVMYVAFSEGIDYTALYAIEQMLDCRTEPCLISSSAMNKALERIGHQRRPGELLFESWRDVTEMARITSSAALKLGARHARIVTCGDYVWVRLQADTEMANLLLRRPVPPEETGTIAPVLCAPAAS